MPHGTIVALQNVSKIATPIYGTFLELLTR
jgi:hypothetical protein